MLQCNIAALGRVQSTDATGSGSNMHQLAVAMFPALIIAAGMLCNAPSRRDAD